MIAYKIDETNIFIHVIVLKVTYIKRHNLIRYRILKYIGVSLKLVLFLFVIATF